MIGRDHLVRTVELRREGWYAVVRRHSRRRVVEVARCPLVHYDQEAARLCAETLFVPETVR